MVRVTMASRLSEHAYAFAFEEPKKYHHETLNVIALHYCVDSSHQQRTDKQQHQLCAHSGPCNPYQRSRARCHPHRCASHASHSSSSGLLSPAPIGVGLTDSKRSINGVYLTAGEPAREFLLPVMHPPEPLVNGLTD